MLNVQIFLEFDLVSLIDFRNVVKFLCCEIEKQNGVVQP